MNSLLKDPRKNYQQSEKINSNPHPDILQNSDSIWFNNQNGYLYLNFQKTCNTFIRIGSWTHGLSIERLEPISECWVKEEFDHGISLIPESSENANDPVQKYVQEIPLNIRQAIKPFHWMQFTLLRIVYNAPEALESVQSNPVMIWMLAERIGKGGLSIEEGINAIFLKRKAMPILEKGQIKESVVRVCRGRNFPDTY